MQPAQTEQPTTADDPIQRLYNQIDALWEQYYQLGEQEKSLQMGDVGEPDLIDIPLPPPIPAMPAEAPLDSNLVRMASIATMLNPMGGAIYMGLPLAEREKRTRTEQERWQALTQSVAMQYRNYLTGVQALNDLRVELWKLKRTKAEDLYRARLQQISSAKQRILDKIAQLENTAARLRETAQYRQQIGEAAMLRAQAAQERVEAEKPLLEARTKAVEAQAERTRTLTPVERALMVEKIRNIATSTKHIAARTNEVALRMSQRLTNNLRSGKGYMPVDDADMRNMSKTFYDLLKQRQKAHTDFMQSGYYDDPEARREAESLLASQDDMLARMAYSLYVSSGGKINKFQLLQGSVAREWEAKARSSVAQIESSKIPVLVFQPAAQPAAQAPAKPSAPAKPKSQPVWKRVWNTILGWLPSGSKPQQQQAKPQQQQQQAGKKIGASASVETAKKVRFVVTDKDLSSSQAKKQPAPAKKAQPKKSSPIKILDVDVK
jgi:hypothetical protein